MPQTIFKSFLLKFKYVAYSDIGGFETFQQTSGNSLISHLKLKLN